MAIFILRTLRWWGAALLLLVASSVVDASQVTLAWSPPADPDVTGYAILYGNACGSYSSRIDVGARTSQTLDLPDGTYYFAVEAYTSTGLTSLPSNEVSATLVTVITPPAPTPTPTPAPAPAAAPVTGEVSAVAGPVPANGVRARGTDAAHDPVHDVFLVVSAFVEVHGVFVDANGAPITAPFQISSGAGHVNFARARYSPDVNNGAGGFLVTWSSEEGRSVNARTRVVNYPGTLGTENLISDGANQAFLESSPALAYSSASRQFLVAWGGVSGVKARLVGLTGAPVGEVVQLSSDYARDPGVTWNPYRNDFGVSFSGEILSGASAGGYSAFAIVPAASPAAFTRQTFNSVPGKLTYITDVDFSPQSRRYVMTWFEFTKTRVAEFDEDGALLADGVASFSIGSYDALSVAFNPVSQIFMLIGISPTADTQRALQLNAHGFPFGGEATVASGPARYSRVGASQRAAVWLSTYADATTGLPMEQAVTSPSTAGGPAGSYPSSSASAPAPAPAPAPHRSRRQRNRPAAFRAQAISRACRA